VVRIKLPHSTVAETTHKISPQSSEKTTTKIIHLIIRQPETFGARYIIKLSFIHLPNMQIPHPTVQPSAKSRVMPIVIIRIQLRRQGNLFEIIEAHNPSGRFHSRTPKSLSTIVPPPTNPSYWAETPQSSSDSLAEQTLHSDGDNQKLTHKTEHPLIHRANLAGPANAMAVKIDLRPSPRFPKTGNLWTAYHHQNRIPTKGIPTKPNANVAQLVEQRFRKP
jgi:hypothetical protein